MAPLYMRAGFLSVTLTVVTPTPSTMTNLIIALVTIFALEKE
jgi:hypothetical protein